MRSISAAIFAGIVVLAFASDLWSADRELPSTDVLLAKLRALDDVYHAGITFRGTRIWLPPADSVRPSMEYQFAFTAQAPRHAYITEAEQVSPPSDLVDPNPQERAVYSPKVGDAKRVNLDRAQVAYFDDQYSANMATFAVFEFGADGKPSNLGDVTTVNMSPWSAASWTLPYKQVMWSSGHGLSDFINRVTEVSWSEEGLLNVKANGFECETNPGSWELQLVPELAYMARTAIFRNSFNDNIFEVRTSGSQEIDGIPLPTDATFAYAGVICDRFLFRSASTTVDEALLAEAKKSIEDRRRPNTFVADARASSPVMGFVNEKGDFKLVGDRGPSSPARLMSPGGFQWRLFLLLANSIAIGGFAIWFLAARFTKEAKK